MASVHGVTQNRTGLNTSVWHHKTKDLSMLPQSGCRLFGNRPNSILQSRADMSTSSKTPLRTEGCLYTLFFYKIAMLGALQSHMDMRVGWPFLQGYERDGMGAALAGGGIRG